MLQLVWQNRTTNRNSWNDSDVVVRRACVEKYGSFSAHTRTIQFYSPGGATFPDCFVSFRCPNFTPKTAPSLRRSRPIYQSNTPISRPTPRHSDPLNCCATIHFAARQTDRLTDADGQTNCQMVRHISRLRSPDRERRG